MRFSSGSSAACAAGDARALPAAQAALDPLLNLMGARRPDGARTLEIRTLR